MVSYSADGDHILLARTAGQHTEVFEMQRQPLCCSKRLTFTSSGDALNPSQSPDGRRMVVTANPLGLPHIYVVSADGGNPSLISRYVFGERGYAAAPDWSPQGDRIAFHAWTENSFQIATAGPDGVIFRPAPAAIVRARPVARFRSYTAGPPSR